MGKYEEDLERARQGKPMDEVFPELKDERIRKQIEQAIIEHDWSATYKVSKDACLAYIEKQKEPMPIPDKFSGLKSLMQQYLQSAANRKDDAEIESDTDLWGRKILDYVWKYEDERQKEPKYTNSENPKEWSEEDEKRVVKLKTLIAQCNGFNKENRKKAFDMIDALRPHWKPSEYQKNRLSDIITGLKRYGNNDWADFF